MDIGALNQAIGGLAVRTANISLMAQVLAEQRVAGAQMVQLIEGSGSGGGSPRPTVSAEGAPAPAPQKGAPEPGKGERLDVVA